MRVIVLAGLLLIAAGARAAAATDPAPSDPASSTVAGAPQGAAPAVIAGALGPIPPDPPLNEEYAHGGYTLFLLRSLLSVATLSIIVISGFAARLQRLAGRITRWSGAQIAVYAALLLCLLSLVTLPFDIWAGFLREKRFGFMNQDLASWLGERGKALAVLIVVEMLVVPLFYLLVRRLGRSWWIPGAALATALVVVGQVIVPVFVAPLFNRFTPLPPSDLRTAILTMARDQGIPAGEVYVVDASRQSEHTNAYVAGLLGSQRIVLYDTLLRRMAPREILFVMGHEMGHYVLKHIWKTIAFLAPLFAAGLFLVDRIARSLVAWRPRWGITGIEQPSSLPLLLLVLSLVSFAARPIICSYSRHQESAADRFGIEVTRDPEAAASSFLKFAQVDLAEIDVNPVIEWALFTHPSTAHRIETAQDWARRHGVAPDAGR
ncbi:MAG TPA: M48 family metallopeptidase [Patescibacteria group bacterium]|nr:M48 family metallopeptidase [Patescibacteria group bacterium]